MKETRKSLAEAARCNIETDCVSVEKERKKKEKRKDAADLEFARTKGLSDRRTGTAGSPRSWIGWSGEMQL